MPPYRSTESPQPRTRVGRKEEGLPAVQRGRLYFIELEELHEWQMGREKLI